MTRIGKTIEGLVRKPRTGVIRIHDFLFDVLHAQMDIRIERDREVAMSNPQPDIAPDTAPEVTPEVTPEITPEMATEDTHTEVTPGMTPKIFSTKKAKKATQLQTYLEVLLGITEVTINTRIALERAANGIIMSDGKIEPSFLKSLEPEQKKILVKLAADYARKIN